MKSDWHPVRGLLGAGLILLFWYVLAESRFANPLWLASPADVARSLVEIARSPLHRQSIFSTGLRLAEATLAVLVIGIPLGLCFGLVRRLYQTFEGVVDFLRSIPPIVVLPIFFFIWPSDGDAARVWLACFGCVPILVMHVASDIKNIPSARLEFARSLGGTMFVLRRVILYEVVANLFVAIRIVVSFAIIIIVVSEMIYGAGIGRGMGDQITSAKVAYDTSTVYAYAVITGLFGVLFNWITRRVEHALVKWQHE